MKILFYNHTGKVSGAERVLLTILTRLDRERFQPLLVCPADGPLKAMAEDINVRTLVSEPLKARFTWRPERLIQYLISLIQIVREVRATIRAESPDVVHANSIRAGLVVSAATTGMRMPIIWHVHDLLPRHPLSSGIRLFAALTNRNRIVAVSEAVARRFRGRVLTLFTRRVPIFTIHNGIELQKFDPNRSHRESIRRSLGADANALLIAIVGQLTPRKGQLELVRAFAEISGDFSQARLLIIGDPIFNSDREYRDLIHSETQELGLSDRIQLLGARDDVPELLQAFDLSVVNSRAEPFGLTVVEAMASCTCVLATAVDGIQEIVEHRQTGWLVPPNDHDELVAALGRLLSDATLRSQLAKKALAEVHQRFSADRLMNQFEALYRQMIDRNKLPAEIKLLVTSRT
ncbi:MAG TPA: glycosyltransferase family 4 protein [Pyrinomonadaceae bacterium]|nr:glycosyltransferase family 4 protein [Pyrinomonadaceae bacterium]